MKIIILARNPKLYSHKRLVEAGTRRGHEIRILDTTRCYMNISQSENGIHYRGGEIITGVDAVIPRIGASITFYGTAVVRHFESQGIYCVNSSVAIARSRDKLRSMQLLAQKTIPLPTTGFANSPEDTEDLIKMVGGAPLIVKLLEGTQGKGIVLAETKNAAKSVINAFKHIRENILVQEYIKEANGTDLRCFVVGDKCVAAYQRVAMSGEFRANIHLGGSALPVKLSSEERKIALRAAHAMGLNVAGVDLIRSSRGPLVLEVNSSPGLEGIETATKKDVADAIIAYIEKHARPRSRASL
ncbi:MAG: 30S ribosomal protein S6--L-glutamate ligase [Myxococcales bacterium]|nr:30S ribosomal protein S6--L-glutamate ligase [Myxococcales bacterium]USN50418.1 MAG: 30S ribosomal protein S6--L-glutamate ligase [Myxococcales bacterium]